MGIDFFWRISHITDIGSLEQLRKELVTEAAEQSLSWSRRIEIYQKVLVINERITQLETN
ncbi:MAG TPA: hypothetical protein VE710_19425 [Candidatus Bathyarchaeia archaeon]|nr:hypothetical protein [Candidatus Bathyarchaeia archaeon]